MISWLEKHPKISWLSTVFIAIFIFYMSSRTFQGIGKKGYLSYIYHFSVFFILAFFLLISSIKGKIRKEVFIIGIILAIVYGISDELHQHFVPGRYPDFIDIMTDSVGILSAGVIYSLRCKSKKNYYIINKNGN